MLIIFEAINHNPDGSTSAGLYAVRADAEIQCAKLNADVRARLDKLARIAPEVYDEDSVESFYSLDSYTVDEREVH